MADYTKEQPGTSGLKNENGYIEVEGDKADIKVQPEPSGLRNAYASRQRQPPREQILPLPPAQPNCVCSCIFF